MVVCEKNDSKKRFKVSCPEDVRIWSGKKISIFHISVLDHYLDGALGKTSYFPISSSRVLLKCKDPTSTLEKDVNYFGKAVEYKYNSWCHCSVEEAERFQVKNREGQDIFASTERFEVISSEV